ncbi:hypothetical protein ABID47_001933 [Paenibacillus favisporus]|uniref:O-antigen polysaccharide polymerase Wzy n=2 Tax=Paenibacillus favisporus TaxID=221028 RepID=A0ABV2F0M0_9BACL
MRIPMFIETTETTYRYPKISISKPQVRGIYLTSMFLVIILTMIGLHFKLYLKTDLSMIYVLYILLGVSNIMVTSRGITWDKIVGWSFFVYSIGTPLYLLTNGGLERFLGTKIYFDEVYSYVTVSESLYYNILFICSFYFAYFLSPDKAKEYSKSQNATNKFNYFHSKLFIHYWLLASAGLFLLGIYKINYMNAIVSGYSLKNPGYVYLFTAVFAINISILILLRMTNFQKKYLVIAAFFHLLLFPLGIRQLTFTFIIQLIMLYKLTHYQFRLRTRDIVIGLTGLVFFGFIGMFRSGGEQTFSFLSLIKSPLRFFFYETTFNYVSFLKCLNLFKEYSINFLYGKTMLDPIIEMIPSFLLNDKNSYQFFEQFIARYSSIENMKPVGTAHLLTELFVNGGIFFIFIFSMVLGFMSKFLNRSMWKAIHTNHFIGQILFSSIIPFVIIQLNRGGISVLIKLSFQFAILPIIIIYLFRKRTGSTKAKNIG